MSLWPGRGCCRDQEHETRLWGPGPRPRARTASGWGRGASEPWRGTPGVRQTQSCRLPFVDASGRPAQGGLRSLKLTAAAEL